MVPARLSPRPRPVNAHPQRAVCAGMSAAVIAALSLLVASLAVFIFSTIAQRRAIDHAKEHVPAALETGPAPPLEVTRRISAHLGIHTHHLAVSAALRELEQAKQVVSWLDSGPLPVARSGVPRRIYQRAGDRG